MTMSNDRVEFTLTAYAVKSGGGETIYTGADGIDRSGFSAIAAILRDVFGLSSNEINPLRSNGSITIRCRPSQFARFLILRNEAGFRNGFKELNPKLICPVERQPHIDVSKRAFRPNVGALIEED